MPEELEFIYVANPDKSKYAVKNRLSTPEYHNLINKFSGRNVRVKNMEPYSKPLVNNTAPLDEVKDVNRSLDGEAS